MPSVAFILKPIRWLRMITKYRVYCCGGPNFAYELCTRRTRADERAELDLSSWRVAYNGAEPVKSETLERFIEAFKPHGFHSTAFNPCYGMAEATLMITAGYPEEPIQRLSVDRKALQDRQRVESPPTPLRETAVVACGKPAGDLRVAIVDPEDFAVCPDGHVGEIWVSGDSVTTGYWRKPDETNQVFGTPKGDGARRYLRTGDLGFMYAEQLYITGRLKDLIIIRGKNHYPQDLEATVENSHPAFRRGCAAAFAVSVENEERLVVAAEIDRGYLRADLSEVLVKAREAIALTHELQAQVVLLRPGTVEKTSSGKIARHSCRRRFMERTFETIGGSNHG
jgi:acyl-CoA synthetase (AMP-forming)/AMP-acid ligase II